ncbi:IS3 family transposase [Ochrobactrum sp. Marseille-Q0166]|uniref:IS3 family transposase n=1 Tax=Ochrobactrum sp. Marseille-Q0166 TaxID=2761105 RepID=UPI0016564FA9|nr:IS3 family transposase [Ochrobactrum sp. Marseille-Q0166]
MRRATRKHYSAEDKIRIVLEGLRGEDSIAGICRREGIGESLYYSWPKEFLEAGKKLLAGNTARSATSDEVRSLGRESRDLKEALADVILENRLLKKKHDRGWGRRRMRYPATEKLGIFRLVEQSHLSARPLLDKLGIPRPTFYRWYDRFQTHGFEGLEDQTSAPSRVWNRIPDDIRDRIIEMALDHADLSPRERAVKFTDTESYFVSEALVYRLLKVHDLITSPASIVIKANDEFKDKTTRPNKMWQTDFTYLKVVGWGWFYLSTILDDYSRYIIAWKLCTSMKVEDVTDTLDLALATSGCDKVKVEHRPRLLSDNASCYVASDLGDWLDKYKISQGHGAPGHPQTQGKIERWHQTLKNRILLENYFFKQDLEAQIAAFVDHYNHRRYHESLDNLTPADVDFRRGQTILIERERIKRDTIKKPRLNHQAKAA